MGILISIFFSTHVLLARCIVQSETKNETSMTVPIKSQTMTDQGQSSPASMGIAERAAVITPVPVFGSSVYRDVRIVKESGVIGVHLQRDSPMTLAARQRQLVVLFAPMQGRRTQGCSCCANVALDNVRQCDYLFCRDGSLQTMLSRPAGAKQLQLMEPVTWRHRPALPCRLQH